MLDWGAVLASLWVQPLEILMALVHETLVNARHVTESPQILERARPLSGLP